MHSIKLYIFLKNDKQEHSKVLQYESTSIIAAFRCL
jgi:hypothetical protein